MKIKVDNELYTVRGVMDRIDEVRGHRHGEAGGVKKIRIVDYKTGKAKEKLSFKEKEQLLIYQLASRDIFQQEIESLVFYYLENNTEVEFLGSKEELKKVEDKIIETIIGIKKGEFSPKPSALCRFCDFFDICEFRKA